MSGQTTIYHLVSQALSDRLLTPETEAAINAALNQNSYISTRDYVALENLMSATASGIVRKGYYQTQAA